MKEDFLHFIWQHRLYDASSLTTTTGDEVVVSRTGTLNRSSGPDFAQAWLSIAGTRWVGAVEIHLRSSDWYVHRHDSDPAYDNVVLHVVYEHDREVVTRKGDVLPVLELKGRIQRQVLTRYQGLNHKAVGTPKHIPCVDILPNISELEWRSWLDRVLVQRLMRKSNDVGMHVRTLRGNWIQVYYTLLAGYIGGNWNKLSMFEMARRIPFTILRHYSDEAIKRESLLLGVANWLPSDAPGLYHREFEHLKRKHDIDTCMLEWKTGSVRPDNAPLNRILQFSGVAVKVEDVFDQLIAQGDWDWSKVDLKLSDYWRNHIQVDKPRKKPLERLSKSMADLIKINVHAPLLSHYGEVAGDSSKKEMAVEMLYQIKPEQNHLMRSWNEWGRKPSSAGDSQAMIELYDQFCRLKKCVICNVGQTLIKRV